MNYKTVKNISTQVTVLWPSIVYIVITLIHESGTPTTLNVHYIHERRSNSFIESIPIFFDWRSVANSLGELTSLSYP